MSSVPTDGRTRQVFRGLQGTSVRLNSGALTTIYPRKMPNLAELVRLEPSATCCGNISPKFVLHN